MGTMKIYVCHSSGYDYQNELYDPLRGSDLKHEIFLPHEHGAFLDTTQLIKDADLVIAEVSFPSTGQGIELGRAEVFGKKILCIHKAGTRYSSSLTFICKDFIEYTSSEDMVEKLRKYLSK